MEVVKENPFPTITFLEDGLDATGDLQEEVALRRQYHKLNDARLKTAYVREKNSGNRPLTCFLHPNLTPCRLLDHLRNRGVSDAVILEWTRRLQAIRESSDKKQADCSIVILKND
ncbi:uncharacterized protein LOC128227328 [Mya arenaria]|uniref:uncharacterized protein LOC128226999 n=1 Tax=Mya arenaria TaxID=6604 RepID=UPI0022E8B54F|nr:uncharacterized protein LOC128226999 [Mya arenaria]XP_052793698.1 uncharacterized protein LOC128227328 [Mya arenaria]